MKERRSIQFCDEDADFGFLSNYFPSPLSLDGRSWPTVEHYYQAMKFPPGSNRDAVSATARPGEAKREAYARSAAVRADWLEVREQVMLRALTAKFTGDAVLRAALLATGNLRLVEGNIRDPFWGVGADGQGRNRLGELLMYLRDQLRRGG